MPWRRLGFSGLADGEQGLDGAAFVHGRVRVGDAVEAGAVVEDEARVEVACKDVLEQLGDVLTRGRNTALDADVLPEQSLVLEVLVEGNADGTDHAAGARDAGAGLDGLVGADALECRVVAALLDDVGGAELLGDDLPCWVAAQGDDPGGSELLGAHDGSEPDGAV